MQGKQSTPAGTSVSSSLLPSMLSLVYRRYRKSYKALGSLLKTSSLLARRSWLTVFTLSVKSGEKGIKVHLPLMLIGSFQIRKKHVHLTLKQVNLLIACCSRIDVSILKKSTDYLI